MDMTPLILAFTSVSDRVAELAVTALWQGLLVAGALALAMRLAPRVSAAHRFAAWAAAFVALAGLPMLSLATALSRGEAPANSAPAAESVSGHLFSQPFFNVDARWSLAIAGLWLAVSLYRAVDLAVHSLRLRRLWMDAEPADIDENVQALLADCVRGPVEVCTTAALQRPSVIGFLKPRILIPDWLFARLTQGELEQIILHEAEHLRRRDDWTNLAQKLCLAVFPLNPALVWIERILCREREMACDDGVIRKTRAPRAYAACLANLAERGLERRIEALSLGAWQRRPELVHRVHSILRNKGGMSPLGARVLMGTVGCGLLAGSLVLARSPRLVAFVPERPAVAAEHPSPAMADTGDLLATAAASGEQDQSRKIGAAASSLPRGSSRQNARNATILQAAEVQNAAVNAQTALLDADVPMAFMARTEPNPDQAAAEQQWVVLTAWEQVETYGDNGALIADYDTVATQQSGATDQPGNWPVKSIAVTQLILRIAPANAGAPDKARSSSTSGPRTDHSTSQPGIAAFHDGWLVLQL